MTPDDIYAKINASFNIYADSLNNYSDTQFAKKYNDETWSLAQMYEHICKSTKFMFLANTVRCIEHRKGQIGGEMNASGIKIFELGSLPSIKIRVPEAFKGDEPEGKSIKVYRHEIIEILEGIIQMMPVLKKDDGTYKINHPVFGFLNAIEWFQSLEMHIRHHLTQKAELESAK